jgi:hypothetical protein
MTKLTTWDSPASEAEVKNIQPVLASIQRLKSAAGGGLIGTQLMVFFLQRQSRISKLWYYSGSIDPSRMSAQDPEKKDLDKRVKSLNTLTAQMEIPALTAAFSTLLIPCLRYVFYNSKIFISVLCLLVLFANAFLRMLFVGPPIFVFSPSSSRGRTN